MLGPLLFDNNLLNMNLKNAVKQKRCTRVILLGEKNQFQQEKIKIEGVAFISKKYLKSHFRDPKKRFFQFHILRSVSTCSLYLLQTLV